MGEGLFGYWDSPCSTSATFYGGSRPKFRGRDVRFRTRTRLLPSGWRPEKFRGVPGVIVVCRRLVLEGCAVAREDSLRAGSRFCVLSFVIGCIHYFCNFYYVIVYTRDAVFLASDAVTVSVSGAFAPSLISQFPGLPSGGRSRGSAEVDVTVEDRFWRGMRVWV